MILITGSKGQLGTECCELLKEKGMAFFATDFQDLDITDQGRVWEVFEAVKPKVVFHTAAYTAVDKAEREGQELNYRVNVEGTKHIAEAAEAVGAALVYISTDYVFDGVRKEGGLLPHDPPAPLNEYGRSKWLGEEIVAATCSHYYIIRTSWVFGRYGANFVHTMLRLAETHSELKVVVDQIGQPTWTRTLAEFMLHLVTAETESGIYHLSNKGPCSWYEFALEILREKNVKVLPVASHEFPQIATRPPYSVLNLAKAEETGFHIPSWQDALNEMLRRD